MKKRGALWLALLLAGVFGWSVLRLFNSQFAGGDLYPAYSTLRTGPVGAGLIFTSLQHVSGVAVSRSYQPLDRLPDRDSTVVLLGLEPRAFATETTADLHTREEFARRGNRLVLAMSSATGDAPPRQTSLEQGWGIRLDFNKESRDIPYFAQAKDWAVLARNGDRVVAVEKGFGKGSVVLVGSGRIFSNQSVAEARQTELLTQILGTHSRIVFDEAHFGITESGSVVALARRYRLHGIVLGLAILTALFIWKNAFSFPPVGSVPAPSRVLGRTSVAGLVTLLRRHVPQDRILAVCWQQWLKSSAREISPERRTQAEAVVGTMADRPPAALREIQTILRAKGVH